MLKTTIIDLIFQFVKINGYIEKNKYYMLQCGHVNEREGGLNLQKNGHERKKTGLFQILPDHPGFRLTQ